MKRFATRTVVAMVLAVLAPAALGLSAQKITFGKLGNKTFGAAPFTIVAAASSGLPVTFASTTTGVCTVGGNSVTLIGAGKCTIRASQSGNATYASAPSVDQSFTVAKASQTISFGPLGSKTIGAPPFALTATASSGLAVTYASLTKPVCAVSGATVTILAAGSCTIRAAQIGNANYNAAPSVDRSFAVASNTNATIQYTHDAVGNLIGVQRVP